MAPQWFSKYRGGLFGIYMFITAMLFTVYYTRSEQIQRRNDPNRISNIKSALELEDVDFLKMVDELKIDYDEMDLREVERNVQSRAVQGTSQHL